MVSIVPAAEVRLLKSSGGVFEITVGGVLRFSKKQQGRFPTEAEVRATLA